MYSEDDNGNVTLTLKHSDYQWLLIALGYASGAASKAPGEKMLVSSFLRLANVMNEGNPEWTPYPIPK